MSSRDVALLLASFVCVPPMVPSGCAPHLPARATSAAQRDNQSGATMNVRHGDKPPAGAPAAAPSDDQNMATMNVRPGEDSQAKILSFDGVTYDAFVSRYAQPNHFGMPIRPGAHYMPRGAPTQPSNTGFIRGW
jgi:hypothetical protein